MENFVKLQHEFFNIYMYKQTADTIGLHFFLQLIDVISSLTPVTTAVPLIGVLALSAVKDAYDDIVSVIIFSRNFLIYSGWKNIFVCENFSWKLDDANTFLPQYLYWMVAMIMGWKGIYSAFAKRSLDFSDYIVWARNMKKSAIFLGFLKEFISFLNEQPWKICEGVISKYFLSYLNT